MLSVAAGSFQFTWAKNSPRSAYTNKGVAGHVLSNVGGRTSARRTSVALDPLFHKEKRKSVYET